MTEKKEQNSKPFKYGMSLKKYTAALLCGWTVIVAVSMALTIKHDRQTMLDSARIQAETLFNMDIVYRKWNARHGGLYAPVTSETQPNPYLEGVISERDIQTPSGKCLTLINPAYMTRQAHEIGKIDNKFIGHITSLKPIRPENAPDPWEIVALTSFENGAKEASSLELIDGAEYMRLMYPLITEKSCLKCHEKQGYKEGDIRGGISVSVPMAPLVAASEAEIQSEYAVHFVMWLFGSLMLGMGSIRLERQDKERSKAEVEREYLNKELQQIIYVTSHDLRSPLVNVEGYHKEIRYSLEALNTILKEIDIPEDRKEKIAFIIDRDIPESVKYIDASIVKMDALLSGLLKLSRSGRAELEMKKLDMNSLVSDVLDTLEYQFREKGARHEVTELPSCSGDEKHINQAFSNLVGNAIKFFDPERPGVIRISGYLKDGHAVYCVEDNGIGIPAEHQDKIFDIFHQVQRGKGGEGLGLSIVKKIVERHNGKVWVESEFGKGSRFYVSLPA